MSYDQNDPAFAEFNEPKRRAAPARKAVSPPFLNRRGRRAAAAMARKHVTKVRLAARAKFLKKLKSAKRAAKKEQTCEI